MRKTVFIIDDDDNLQTVLEIALSDAGYAVEQALDGATALAYLRTHTPDLVLCDIIMPYVDGVQVWQVLRERLQYAGVPFMLLTALARKPWFAKLEAEGVVILHKPFDLERLVALIHSYLDDVFSDP